MNNIVQPLDLNTLHTVHIIEELIQHIVGSYVEIIANFHWTKDLVNDFSLSTTLQGCCISA